MKEDGFDNGFEDMKNESDKRFSLMGDYRKMIGKAEALKYHMITYSDPDQNLTVNYNIWLIHYYSLFIKIVPKDL